MTKQRNWLRIDSTTQSATVLAVEGDFMKKDFLDKIKCPNCGYLDQEPYFFPNTNTWECPICSCQITNVKEYFNVK